VTALLLAFVGSQSRAAEMFPTVRRALSMLADGRKAKAVQSNDDSLSMAPTDDDVESTGASKSSSGSSTGGSGGSDSDVTSSSSTSSSTSTTTPSHSSSVGPNSTTRSSSNASSSTITTKHHSSSGNATRSSNSTNSTNSSSTDDSTEDGAGGVSEWSFHNESALKDAKYNLSLANTTTFLPPEKEQPESWTFAVLIIFSGLAAILISVTAYKTCSRRSKRHSYEEIENLVV